MIDRHKIDAQGRRLGVECKRSVAQRIGHVDEGSPVDATLVNAYFADLPDDKRATIRDAGIAIAA